MAEFERGLIRERTKAGLAAARARGRVGGRPAKLTARDVRRIRLLLADPETTVTALARDYGVSRTTLYRHVGIVPPAGGGGRPRS
ncbi:MAG: Hin recombinase [Rhizobiales bacterium]|nr:Hin recombinase [Hyphomicrobiales bacterium]